ncbi:MAG: hypothetical protein MJ141_03405 [Clostridia bacterium]|nr:hypothetical protein [Clostridia bacterium]
MSSLVVTYSRSGLSRAAAEKIASALHAETLEISDGKAYKGAWGYCVAAVVGLKKKLPKLLPYKTSLPLGDYEKIILVSPVWCENVSPFIRAFLSENKDAMKGQVIPVITHMSGISYLDKVEAMMKDTGKDCPLALSLQTRNHDWVKDTEEFLQKLL